jgi:hypothetical protein
MRRELIYFAIAVALLLVLGGPVRTFVARGKRLTRTTLDSTGNVAADPHALAAAAGELLGELVGDEEYALARMVSSEEGDADRETKVAIAWVAVNDAQAFGGVVQVLTYSTTSSERGYFGDQTGRRYSTARDPYEDDLAVARAVLSGMEPDTTGGSTHFFRSALQDVLLAQGRVSRSAAEVDDKWRSEGFEPYAPAGADSDITFYRRAG